MRQGQLQQLLADGNPWWERADWERDDPDLVETARAPFLYEPDPLRDIAPDGLFVFRGPRRVGKSVEVKRAVSRLIRSGVDPRAIVCLACNGLTGADLLDAVRAAQRLLGPRADRRRYWFLDEITAAKSDWSQAIARLRDTNLAFKQDCVVLTGSSSRSLVEATKALAGRRGSAARSDRLLLPMGFRDFCAAVDPGASFPQPAAVHPRDFWRPETDAALYELAPFLARLTGSWDLYLQIGGFPRAVADFVRAGSVGADFVDALWQVVHGEAIRREHYGPATTLQLLAELAGRLTAPVNLTQLAEDTGLADHSVAGDRIADLVLAYLAWPCYKGKGDRPHLAAQRKVYFIDPLLARLAHLRDRRFRAPDPSALSEQQIGLALCRALGRERPGTFSSYSDVVYAKPARNEIDFVSGRFGDIAFEAKYVDDKKTGETRAIHSQGLAGIMATHAFFDLEGTVKWIPSAFVAWLLEPEAGTPAVL